MSLDPKHPVYILVYSAIVAVVFTAAIIGLQVATAGIVQRNEALLKYRGLVEALFGRETIVDLSDQEIIDLAEKQTLTYDLTDPATGESMTVYAAFDEPVPGRDAVDPAHLTGYAFPVSGIGFWARIDGYLAVTPDLKRVKGFVILRHQETPGLGGRATEWEFRRQFVGLDITPPPADDEKWLYVGGKEYSGDRAYRNDRRVDAITGATGTTNALDRFLNDDIPRFRRAFLASDTLPKAPNAPTGDAAD